MAIFSDGFESGDFSAWSGTSNNPSVVGSPVNSGSYSMLIESTDSSPCYAYTSDPNHGELYMRIYGYITDSLSAADYLSWMMYYGGEIQYLRVYNDGGTVKIQHYDGSSVLATADWSYSTNTWYCIEWRVKIGSSNGESQCWIDGTQQWNNSGLDTGSSNIILFYAGGYVYSHPDYNIDDCVVDSSYIGPISAAIASRRLLVGVGL